ncbi:liver carboxylesterase 1-like [Sturnira hondurensis]|uniref:liver carboxylesterase 1-like n=1 Tax=Sturnira hondurensis TaxID=192404 RepID=UPI001879872D|nr:liver carboxylesterase 1-like [Sturnira hondurensis]
MVGFTKQEFGWLLPMLMGYPISEGGMDQETATSLLWKSYPVVGISEELVPVAIEKYLGGTDDPIRKKDLFLDLMGDVMFTVPSMIVARHSRGESQRSNWRDTSSTTFTLCPAPSLAHPPIDTDVQPAEGRSLEADSKWPGGQGTVLF